MHVGFEYEGKRYTFEEVDGIAYVDGSFAGFPLHVLNKLRNQDRDPRTLSPSQATECPRSRILKWEEDYYEKLDRPQSVLRRFFGSAIHSALEHDGEFSENRIVLTLSNGIILSGQPDDVYDGTIWDNKTIEAFRKYDPKLKKEVNLKLPDPAHIIQLNLYALLLRSQGVEVEQGKIWYVRRSGETQRICEIPIWAYEEQLAMALECSQSLADWLQTGGLPEAYGPDHPEYWRCTYCPVAQICAEKAMQGL